MMRAGVSEAMRTASSNWNLGFLNHRTDQAIHSRNAAGKSRTVGQLANTVFDDHTRVKRRLAVTGGASQRIGDQNKYVPRL